MLRLRELIARLCVDKEGCYQLQPFCASTPYVTSALYLSHPTQLRTSTDALKELFDSDPDNVMTMATFVYRCNTIEYGGNMSI